MDNAVVISFGPYWDIWFRIFLVMGTLAFSGIIASYLEAEIRSWFGKKKDLDVEYEEDEKTLDYDSFVSNNDPVRAHYAILDDGAVVNNFSGEKREPESEENISALQDDEIVKEMLEEDWEPFDGVYIVQWSTSSDFDQFSSTELRRSPMPGATALELLAAYGSGHIRWRLAGDDNSTPEWKYQGFYSSDGIKEIANG